MEPPIRICVEPPTEDQCTPLDFGDSHVVIDSSFDPTNCQYFPHPFFGFQPEGTQDFYAGSGNQCSQSLNDQVVPATEYHPYTYGSFSYNDSRSPTDDYSPYSSTLGDDFSPTTSPSIHGGQLSPSHSNTGDVLKPPLSPTQINELSLPFDEMNLEHKYPFRARSHSVIERTVAPSDVWCDPSTHTGVRSAPPATAPLPGDTSPDCTISSDGSDCGVMSPAYEFDFLTLGHGPYIGVSAEMNPTQAESQDVGTGLLLQTVSAYPPPSPDTQFRHPRIPHHRSSSESSAFLSPTSPVDQRRPRMHRRKADSISGPPRHTPYPASAPSTPEQAFGHTELAGAPRRYSGPPPSRPKLLIPVTRPHEWNDQFPASPQQVHASSHGGEQVVGSSYVSDDVNTINNEWYQANVPSPSLQIAQVMPGQPQMYTQDQLSPSSAISNTSQSVQKDVVGSRKIVDASTARRKRDCKFICAWPNCRQTFTAKHNAKYHLLSHTGERPFPCGICLERFTTPGVANRHRAKCLGPGGTNKRRRSRSTTARTA